MPKGPAAVSQTSSNVMDKILCSAIDYRSSDVHLEPDGEVFNVRFRVDGILYPVKGLTGLPQDAITSRIKVLAEMDLFEHRLPQDGHFEFSYNDQVYNVRVSTVPTVLGQAVVLRLFNRENLVLEISNLGFEPEQLERVGHMLTSPYGINLITGQIGSGKTTLLYSMLSALNNNERNIITLEDPVEFQMLGIRQLQVNEGAGFTFDKAIRAAVRQDPDVIMLGEIRDSETAQSAFQAALTGSLVFSTFHTFDVAGLVIRLIEMGIPRSVVAHALTGIVSTRLVRKICSGCRAPVQPGEDESRFLGNDELAHQFYAGAGCEECHQTGYRGRIGIYEVVLFDEDIRTAIIEEHDAATLRNLVREKVGLTLHDAALAKIHSGATTVNEIVRVIGHQW